MVKTYYIIEPHNKFFEIQLYSEHSKLLGKIIFNPNPNKVYLQEFGIDNIDTKFIYLSLITVFPQFRNNGYGNKLMTIFLDYIKTEIKDAIVLLNAFPSHMNLPVDILEKFYEKFGFLTIEKSEFNALMVKV